MSTSEQRKWACLLGYGAGVLMFIAIGIWGGQRAITAPFQPNLVPFLLCFIITGLIFLTSGIRWAIIVNALSDMENPVILRYVSYFLLSRFTGHYISAMGSDLVVRPLLLRSADKSPLSRGFGGVLLDKAFDLLFVTTLLIPAILIILQAIPTSALVVSTLIALLLPWIVTLDNRLLPSAFWGALRLASRVGSRVPLIRHRIPDQAQMDHLRFHLLSRRKLVLILGLSLLKYGGLVLRLLFLVQALDLPISVTTIWAGIPIQQFSELLAFTPGALGILEASWYTVLSVTNVNPEAISTFLIGQRLYWLAFAAVFALVGYIGLGVESLPKAIKWLRRN